MDVLMRIAVPYLVPSITMTRVHICIYKTAVCEFQAVINMAGM